jgi:hypothetical protein
MHPLADRLLPIRFDGGCLRRLRRSGLGAFQAYRSIPELGRYQGWSPMSEAEALAFLVEMEGTALFQPGRWVQLGIADPSTKVLLGDIGVRLSEDSQTAEVGFTLAPLAQGPTASQALQCRQHSNCFSQPHRSRWSLVLRMPETPAAFDFLSVLALRAKKPARRYFAARSAWSRSLCCQDDA